MNGNTPWYSGAYETVEKSINYEVLTLKNKIIEGLNEFKFQLLEMLMLFVPKREEALFVSDSKSEKNMDSDQIANLKAEKSKCLKEGLDKIRINMIRDVDKLILKFKSSDGKESSCSRKFYLRSVRDEDFLFCEFKIADVNNPGIDKKYVHKVRFLLIETCYYWLYKGMFLKGRSLCRSKIDFKTMLKGINSFINDLQNFSSKEEVLTPEELDFRIKLHGCWDAVRKKQKKNFQIRAYEGRVAWNFLLDRKIIEKVKEEKKRSGKKLVYYRVLIENPISSNDILIKLVKLKKDLLAISG